MADEPLSIRGVHWRDALPFTHLFRAFRVAIHPSKIVLALAALLLLYVGGHALDWLWPVADRAVPQEVSLYERFSGHAAAGQSFADVRRGQREAVEADYARRLLADKVVATQADAAAAARTGDHLGELKTHILDRRRAAVDEAEKGRATALPLATDAAARASVEGQYRDLVRSAYEGASAEYRSARRIRNDGLFDTFFEYESNQVTNLVHGVRQWNWFGSDRDEADAPLSVAEPFVLRAAALNPLGLASAPELDASLAMPIAGSPGIVPSVERFFAVGPLWLMTQHPVYFALFATGFLFLWSIFGGAISRIAAVHVARDEKLSIRAALVFSVGKFLSYLCAPLIPLGILAAVGLLTALCALVGNIPGIGPIVMGAAFVLALVAGLVMAVVLVGLVGGFNLMYPTIAVEGSDSFDAISRSFSYLYARPWRLAFYTAVSVVYGSACYLFVRLFIYLVLALTHRSVALGLFTHADSTAPLLSALWPDPATAGRLSYDVDTLSLSFPQEVAAGLIWFWVHLAIAVLGAFAVSFYFAANTIIYYLLRQEVDATDLNEVFVDPSDEDDADEPDPAEPVHNGTTTDKATPSAAAAEAAEAAPPT
jgi:hypothetical protein